MNFKIFLLILSFYVLFFNVVYAQGIKIIVPERPITVYAGQMNEIKLLIENDEDSEDIFYFSFWPTDWVSLKEYWLSFNPHEIRTLTLSITPPRDTEEGMHVLTLTTKSLNFNFSSSQKVYLNVQRLTNIYLSEIRVNKQVLSLGETLNIQPVITNVGKENEEVSLTTDILRDKSIIQKFDDTFLVGPKSTKIPTYSFNVRMDNPPGSYEIKVSLKTTLNKLIDEKSINFTIQPFHKLEKEKKSKNNLFYTTVTVRITNEGNVRETNFYVTESMPSFLKNFFYPEMEPISQEEKNNRIVYSWLIHDLDPGQSLSINYQLRFENAIIISCILIVAIVWVGWLFYRPKLMKKYLGMIPEKKEYIISLHVKNKRKHPLNNLVVRDFVPAIATVVKKFDTLAPKIKRKAMGTELTWKIKQLKPKEERILTYRIKPVIEFVGKLKLPKAYLIYRTKSGKSRRVLSKRIKISAEKF